MRIFYSFRTPIVGYIEYVMVDIVVVESRGEQNQIKSNRKSSQFEKKI